MNQKKIIEEPEDVFGDVIEASCLKCGKNIVMTKDQIRRGVENVCRNCGGKV